MKILFDHPNPFFLAHGGFQIQIEQTKLALERAGVEVDWLRWWDVGQKADLIHYFGRAHPAYIRQCHDKGMAVVMQELLTGLGSRGPITRSAQKLLMLTGTKALPREFLARLCWESYGLADAIVANTAWERQLMIGIFDAPPEKVHLVPNGVEEIFFLSPDQIPQREPHLICTATITPRKRVLELCWAAQLARVPLYIYGAPYAEKDLYFQEFLWTIKQPNTVIKYMGASQDRRILSEAYKKAAGFVLLSTMETRSLSAEEASAAGCPLLLSDLPWARSVFGEKATYCPDGQTNFLATRLKKFYFNLAAAPRPAPPLRWIEVAKQLKEIYLEAISSR